MVRLRVGLTGGIGCGKSSVARSFSAWGVPVIDADEIARELVRPGTPAFHTIAETFGAAVLHEGQLDRSLLREVIFRDEGKRRQLEAILHPQVFQEMAERCTQLADPYCVLCIPLLIETGRLDFVDRILVVDCSVEIQIRRVMSRDAISEAAVRRMIDSQVSRGERLAAADDVIENGGDLALMDSMVEKLHRDYLALAAEAR
jgi:dephospho-CoA kinase